MDPGNLRKHEINVVDPVRAHHFAGSGFRIGIDSNSTLSQKISLSEILKIMTPMSMTMTIRKNNVTGTAVMPVKILPDFPTCLKLWGGPACVVLMSSVPNRQ
jgi:hypothetical protein